MAALGAHGFPVPRAVEHNRHAVLMSLVDAALLVQARALSLNRPIPILPCRVERAAPPSGEAPTGGHAGSLTGVDQCASLRVCLPRLSAHHPVGSCSARAARTARVWRACEPCRK